MDPLSVTASIVGILAAAGKISELLHFVVSTAKEAPGVVTALIVEINDVRAAVQSLQGLLEDIPLAPPRRTALIQLDQLIVTLTESVLTFSELESIVAPLVVPKGETFTLRARLKWTRVESNCTRIVEKLQRHKTSISLMLNILQCASDAEATRSQESLVLLIQQLLESNQGLCKRLRNLEDVFDARSTITKKYDSLSLVSGDEESIKTARTSKIRHGSIIEAIKVRFSFDADLEASRVYRMAKNDYCDRSFVSSAIRTNAWSIFSGLSLADISIVSVVALPLYPRDIVNREHYSFSNTKPTPLLEPTGRWTNSRSSIKLEHSKSGQYRDLLSEEIVGKIPVLMESVREELAPVVSGVKAEDGYDEHTSPCRYCGKILEEGEAFELRGNRWHVGCFRCNTCSAPLDPDSNGQQSEDGSLICNNCAYNCSHCGNKIEDLAILDKDQAICENCYRCRSCNHKIRNLHYARTDQGMLCMPCYRTYKIVPALRSEPGLEMKSLQDNLVSLEFALTENTSLRHSLQSKTLYDPKRSSRLLRCMTCKSQIPSRESIQLTNGSSICRRAQCIPRVPF